jgi:4,5-dihydroxyphthalate decarboxylase
MFPIMHVIAIRRDLVGRYAWLPSAVLKAFSQAKAMSMASMQDVGALEVTLPRLLALRIGQQS